MAQAKAIVLSASIDNEHAIREWIESVQGRCRELQEELDGLTAALRDAPHISITLHQSKSG